MSNIKTPKKLIEVALPLDDINIACACQSALKSIHLTASNNVQQLNKVIPFSAPFYAA